MSNKLITIFVAVAVAMSLLALAPAAVTAEEEDAQELLGDGTDEVLEFAADEDELLEYTLDADGEDFDADGTTTLHLNVSYDGVDHYEVEVSEDFDGADTDYTFELTHADLETIPGGAEETTVVEVSAWGENDDGDVTTGETEEEELIPESFEVDLVFDRTHAAIYVHDADEDAFASFEEDEGLSSVWILDNTHATIDDSVEVTNETDVQVHVADSDIQDQIDFSTENTDDGDRVGLMMASTVDGDLVYVFDGEPGETILGDDVEDEGDAHMVVYDDDHVTIYSGDDFEDDDEVSVGIVANDRPSVSDLRDDLEYGILQALGGAWGISMPFVGAVLAGGLVATRRRAAA